MSTFGREEDERRAKLKVVSSQRTSAGGVHQTASRLRDMRYPEPSYVIPGFILKGLASSAEGRRWASHGLRLSLPLASRLWRKSWGISCRIGRCPLCSARGTFPRLQRRIKKLLWPARPSWPERLALATQWRRLDEGGVEDIADWAQGVDAPRLVILDTLAGIRPKRDARAPPTTVITRRSWTAKARQRRPLRCGCSTSHAQGRSRRSD